jgi:hypothetical protein
MKAALVLALLACLPASAWSQSFRCSERIISEGTTRAEVAGLCGDPAQIEHKSIFNTVSAGVPGPSGLTAGTSVEVRVELWTYNFGPNKLMQRVRFEDGIVVHIESLGYGF